MDTVSLKTRCATQKHLPQPPGQKQKKHKTTAKPVGADGGPCICLEIESVSKNEQLNTTALCTKLSLQLLVCKILWT